MTRAATAGLLPEEVVNGARSKHAQPVIDDMQKAQSFSPNELYRPRTASSSRSQPNGYRAEDHSDSEDEGLEIAAINGSRQARPTLSRAKSDFERGQKQQQGGNEKANDDVVNMRHGWESQLQNEEVARNLSENFFMYYLDKRHETAGNVPPDFDPKQLVTEWRMKDRLKTVSALLAVCLNVGVDPPDVIKTNPCARLECWVDPVPPDSTNQNSNNTNAQIGKNLQSQYENLSLRSRYKVVLDPTIEELKKYTQSLRRTAHQERILFHYNGHGVPKPTASGEVWCFNRSYTQYIPISLVDLQEWVGAPGLWVWDCSAASGIIQGFLEAAQKHSLNQQEALKRDPNRTQQQPLVRWEDCIHLAACKQNEVLPTNPDLPADLFTSCLTTPIMMAVRFFILQNPLTSTSGVTLAQARNIPGKVSERRTPLGELNWIFTAITDTIAWNCLDKPLFKKLFRQDLMVAALFRNFLLAQRVMRMYHCHPQSHPRIPDTHDHPLWKSWDLAVEMILAQLPRLIEQQKANEAAAEQIPNGNQPPQQPQQLPELEYQHSDFFADQLSAFEVYLSCAPCNPDVPGYARPPEQLPIVLQVLLSQVHRLRALVLLSKFLDLGPWAVNLALSIGIFPYVLKLLQSQALELKAPMVFIWARILAVDQTCQTDLLKDAGFSYFTNILIAATGIPTGNLAEHRAMCTFVIAMFCKDFKQGKSAVLENTPELIEHCLQHLHDMENPLLRQFSLLCLSHLVRDYPPAREAFIQHSAQDRIADRSHDPVPEVRAACVNALASYVATHDMEHRDGEPYDEKIVGVICSVGMDGSIMVRKELTVLYSEFVHKYENRFVCAAWEQLLEEQSKKLGNTNEDDFLAMQTDGATEGNDFNGLRSNSVRSVHQRSLSSVSQKARPTSAYIPSTSRKDLSLGTIYRTIWRQLMSLSTDPHPEVARNAGIVVDYVLNALLESPLGPHAEALLEQTTLQAPTMDTTTTPGDILTKQRTRETRPETPPSPVTSTASRPDGYFALSRTASVAQAMKSFIGWGKTPSEVPSTPTSPTHGRRSSVYSTHGVPYRSRPLTPADAAQLPPDVGDNIPGPPHQPPAKVPPTPLYRERDITEMPVIPLKSNFFDWSASYFREPQMRPSETDQPGSKDYNERLWRRNRNDKIIASTQPLKEAAGTQRWDKPCGYFGIGAAPVRMVFHQFENHLVTSDDRDSIAVWDWAEAKQLNRFSNGNPKNSRVTEVRFINEDDMAMLMTGSSDGVIKLFRDYEDPKKIQHVSSFRALNDLIPSDRQSSGLVFDWQQGQGRALVAGDDRVVRVWQVGQEMCVSDIQTRSSACITSLTSDQVEGNIFVAGFGNGSVKVFDQRLPNRDQMHMSWHEHKSWVVGVHLQRGGMRELISAESNGGIRLWDIRMRASVDQYNPSSNRAPRSLRTLSVHEHAPVFATGGKDHVIRVYSTTDVARKKPISSFEPYMSYLRGLNTSRNAPITATAFHPHRMMLACGAVNDGHVNLFKCDVQEVGEKGGGVIDATMMEGVQHAPTWPSNANLSKSGTVAEWR